MRPDPVLITTDLDRTLIFSPRAISQLGGGLPAERIEAADEHVAGELCHAARDALAALPAHAELCVATSRSVRRLGRLRLPFRARYAIAANGGVVLADGEPDREWAARTAVLLAGAAPAAEVRAVLAAEAVLAADGRAPWLIRMGDDDQMCCLAIVDEALVRDEPFARVAARCGELGWTASLVGRKLYAFPAGFGKEHAADYVAKLITREGGSAPFRLAAGDTDHDRPMLAAADLAWVPAGSELAAACAAGTAVLPRATVTRQPGHAAAAQITADWLAASRRR